MFRYCLITVLLCSLAGTPADGQTVVQPPPVPRLVERTLDHASYVELARQWKAYIEKHGETADALVNLGMAYEYSEEHEAAIVAARRAVALEPDDPRALALLGKLNSIYEVDEDEALKLLKRCREVAPDYEHGLTTLAAVHLRRGDLPQAEEVFRTIFDQRIISRPLQDYAYNMLVGLPEGAVLISAGDNDTFPALALQAGMNFRRDVVVLNQSLLNLPAYVEAQFKRHASIRPDYNIGAHKVMIVNGHPTWLSHALIAKMIEEKKAPVYLTMSTAGLEQGYRPEVYIEGMNLRASGKGLPPDESAQLFFTAYRLDSATDWTEPWSLAPNEAKLMSNYVSAMVKLAEEKGVGGETRARLLEKAAAIAEFHELDRMSEHIRALSRK
jgi:tetratricopeptide (TPR) repeat protein